jgi:cell division protein ZapA
MNIDLVLGIAVGAALAGILIVPLCILVYSLVRGHRTRRDAEALQTANVAALIDDIKRELESLRHESERWAKSNAGLESAKLQWKKQYDDLLQKHNALVRTHNDLVRKYNAYLKQAKSQAGAKTEADSQLRAFSSEVQELRVRLDEALKGKQNLLTECQGLQGKIEILDSERGELHRKLADALKQLQTVSSSPPPSSPSSHQPELASGDLLSEIADLRRKIEDNNRCNDELVARINHFRQDMEDLARQNRELDRQLKEHQGVNAALAREHATDREQGQEVERENQALRVENQALEEKRREAVSQHEKLIHDHQGHEQEAEKLRSENSALSQKLEELARHLQMALAGLSAGYPGFVVPSLVRLNAGKLYFGRRALQENGGSLFRSLKVALLRHQRCHSGIIHFLRR